jgi:hypothetical protein
MIRVASDADLVLDDLVDEAVLVGDPAGPVTLEPLLQRLWLADSLVAVALDISNQGLICFKILWLWARRYR